MAYIYQAEIWCHDCGEKIKDDILTEHPDWEDKFEFEDEYDSDEFPKYANDDAETDCPQHCGSGADCINAIELSDGSKIGCLIGTALTTDGIEYVKQAVKEGGLCAELWRKEFDYIEFDNRCDWCDCIMDDEGHDGLCDECFAESED